MNFFYHYRYITEGMSEQDILDGVGNEVVYFFGKTSSKYPSLIREITASVSVFLVLVLVTVIAWYSTYVVEPVVQSVILVERSPVAGTSSGQETEINSSTVEEVRQAVTQFLQQQQLETQGPGETDTEPEPGEQEPEQVRHSRWQRSR